MYIVSKVGIVALAVGVGVGGSYSFWAAQRRDEVSRIASFDAPVVPGPPSNHESTARSRANVAWARENTDDGLPVVSLSPAPFPPAPVRTPQAVATSPSAPEMAKRAPPLEQIVVYVVPDAVGRPPAPASSPITEPRSEQSSPARCGAVMCSGDQVCCDASCGTCASLGAPCSQAPCG
jgi:hypothetical protein